MSKSSKHILCSHFPICSGCIVNENVELIPVYVDAKRFFESKGIYFPPLNIGNVCGWRCRAKLAVRGRAENPDIGLFKANTHEVINIPFCKVHHPQINVAVEVIKRFISQVNIQPYEEHFHKGILRYLQLTVEQTTGKIQLVLVCNQDSETAKDLKRVVNELWESNPSLWHSIWLNFNQRKDNVIFGKEWLLIKGEPFLQINFGGKESSYHPASFIQANFEMFEKMLQKIQQKVPQNSKVVEFYSGAGVIGLMLVDKCQWIRCCEINPLAQKCFEEALQRLDPDISKKISFYSLDVKKGIHLADEAEVMIVDPPRKGLDPFLLNALLEMSNLKQLIYVSCNWSSFQQDYEKLCQQGWRLEEIETYLFFPGSNHIELLGIFVRKI